MPHDDGLGGFTATDENILEVAGDQICRNFYTRVNGSFCLNWNFNKDNDAGMQWCYVSSACQELGANGKYVLMGGHQSDLAYKECSSEFDDLTITKSPLEIEKIAVDLSLDLGTLAKWTTSTKGMEGSMDLGSYDVALNSPYTTLWDSEDGRPPFLLISAHDENEYKLKMLKAPDGMMAAEEGRLGKVFGLECSIGDC